MCVCVCLHCIYMYLYINKEQNIESVWARTIKSMYIFPWLPNIYLVDSEWILSEKNNSALISEKSSFNYYSKYCANVSDWKTCYGDDINTFFRSLIFLVVIATIETLKTTFHYSDVITGPMGSQNTSPINVYSSEYSGTDQRKHLISASLAFVRGFHRWPLISRHRWPLTRKMFKFYDVIMHIR